MKCYLCQINPVQMKFNCFLPVDEERNGILIVEDICLDCWARYLDDLEISKAILEKRLAESSIKGAN